MNEPRELECSNFIIWTSWYGDKFKIKASDIFHLMQYLKTEIQLEKHNSAKKTVSTYITNELRPSN